jgi:hypothetical protein
MLHEKGYATGTISLSLNIPQVIEYVGEDVAEHGRRNGIAPWAMNSHACPRPRDMLKRISTASKTRMIRYPGL